MKSINVLIAEAAASYTACPSSLSAGVTKFGDALTSSHSLTSRRHSIWQLLKLHVDEPFADAIRYEGAWHRALLTDFKPSRAGRYPGPEALAALSTYEPLNDLATPRAKDDPSPPIIRVTAALERWIQCLRMSIHSCYGADRSPGSESFAKALDLIRDVLHILKRLRPRHRAHPIFGRVREVTDRDEQYCELCWRPSMRATDIARGRVRRGKRPRSARFCEVHDSRNPKSRYQTDLAYKAAFHRELEAVWNFAESAYAFELPGLPHSDEGMLRHLAYDRAHASIRAPNSREGRSLKERVWTLKLEGLSQAEIARSLGISRQAVNKTMSQLRAIWDEHQQRLSGYLNS